MTGIERQAGGNHMAVTIAGAGPRGSAVVDGSGGILIAVGR